MISKYNQFQITVKRVLRQLRIFKWGSTQLAPNEIEGSAEKEWTKERLQRELKIYDLMKIFIKVINLNNGND